MLFSFTEASINIDCWNSVAWSSCLAAQDRRKVRNRMATRSKPLIFYYNKKNVGSMLFSAHPNIHYRTVFLFNRKFRWNFLLNKKALRA